MHINTKHTSSYLPQKFQTYMPSVLNRFYNFKANKFLTIILWNKIFLSDCMIFDYFMGSTLNTRFNYYFFYFIYFQNNKIMCNELHAVSLCLYNNATTQLTNCIVSRLCSNWFAKSHRLLYYIECSGLLQIPNNTNNNDNETTT